MSLLAPTIAVKATAYTATYGDLVLANATSGAFAVTLPLPAFGLAPIRVKKTDASANAVTVTRSGVALIDGAPTYVLSTQYSCIEVVPDGINWQVVAKV